MSTSVVNIVTWHGENRTVFYVVLVASDEDWQVLATFRTRESAESFAKENQP